MSEELFEEEVDQNEPVEDVEQDDNAEPEAEKPVEESPKEVPTVPIHALHEARMQTRQLKGELEELRQNNDRMTETFNKVMERFKAADDPIDPEEAASRELREKVNSIDERLQTKDTQEQQTAQEMQFRQSVDAQEAVFMKDKPDYYEAINFLRTQRNAQYEAMGMYDEGQRAMTIQEETRWIVNTATNAGKNPAEAAYNVAVSMGYKAAEPSKAGGDELDRIEAGQKAGRKMSASSLEELADVSDDEFDSAFKSMFG